MPQIKSSFILNSKYPLDLRNSFNTINDMNNYPVDHIDEGHISYCVEDKNYYKFINGSWQYFLPDVYLGDMHYFDTILEMGSCEPPVNFPTGQLAYCAEDRQIYYWAYDDEKGSSQVESDPVSGWFLPLAKINDSLYLKIEDAQKTYVTKTDADATYITKADTQSTYVTKTDADATYLTEDAISQRYLKKNDAEKYIDQSELNQAISKFESDKLTLYIKLVDADLRYLKAENANSYVTKVDQQNTLKNYLKKTDASATYATYASLQETIKDLGVIEGRVGVLETTLSTVSNQTLTNKTTIEGLTGVVAGQGTSISNLQQTIDELSTDFTETTEAISGEVESLKQTTTNSFTEQSGVITETKNDLSILKTSYETTKTQVDNIQQKIDSMFTHNVLSQYEYDMLENKDDQTIYYVYTS